MKPLITRRNALSRLGGAVAASLLLGTRNLAQGNAAAPSTTAPDRPTIVPASLPDYEQAARKKMSHGAWETIASGSADEMTLQWNREALTRLRIHPRVMIDVANIDLGITLLGRKLPHPILLAPTAAHMLLHPDGEVATAQGAGAARTVMVASTVSNRSIEEINAAASGPIWFQLYVAKDRGLTRELIERAEAAGSQAMCVTVDLPVVYARNRVDRVTPELPPLPLPNLKISPTAGWKMRELRSAAFNWKDVEWLQSFAKKPILLKGILHPADAELAVKSGVAGIIVSNHGGRGLDSVPATIDALPRVTEKVAGRIPVLVDGGIRRGTDILKGLAYGASAVLIGRPYLYGLAVNGAEGVRHVVEILRTELEAAMALTGKTSIAAIDSSVVSR